MILISKNQNHPRGGDGQFSKTQSSSASVKNENVFPFKKGENAKDNWGDKVVIVGPDPKNPYNVLSYEGNPSNVSSQPIKNFSKYLENGASWLIVNGTKMYRDDDDAK